MYLITDRKLNQCVFEVDRTKEELMLTELAPSVKVEEIRNKTGAKFTLADHLKDME